MVWVVEVVVSRFDDVEPEVDRSQALHVIEPIGPTLAKQRRDHKFADSASAADTVRSGAS
ncbi:MAG: hypothetical protein QOF12_2214 [Solirubrobacteraceae bacterium]|nr:hypothetical protein [Solirubrobacteraceae bacterium]